MIRRAALTLAWLILACGCSTTAGPRERLFHGVLSYRHANGVEGGRLTLGQAAGGQMDVDMSGYCLGVSLPDADVERLKADGPRMVTVRGYRAGVPTDEEIATIAFNGRPVPFRQCGYTYVFVGSSQDIAWGERANAPKHTGSEPMSREGEVREGDHDGR